MASVQEPIDPEYLKKVIKICKQYDQGLEVVYESSVGSAEESKQSSPTLPRSPSPPADKAASKPAK